MSVIVDYYKDLMYNRNDPRTQNWFLISSPGPLLLLIFSYIYFSVSLGPRLMRNRKPFDLRKTLIIYNFIQVLLSIYIVHEALMSGWLHDYSYTCQPVDYSNNPQALRMAKGVYFYFACKLIELLDTLFFVMRKKQRQISFLHVYHHAMMPICAWIGVRFVPGGHATLLGLINSFIHVLMYTYYMLSAFGPNMQKFLWWKRHLTSLQLVQFTIIFFHNLQVLVTNCNYPKPLSFLLCINAALFIYLFGSFYVKTYNVQKRQDKDKGLAYNNHITNGHVKTNGHSTNLVANGHAKTNDKSD
ncbi:elongation of very long chain fatty acids protein AAEL008004-like [Phymastichus coffea]|uniref:elongation of very long chain fatty acids protein AAEL008004-like n=1 Tax=Phymastichus coffea TaxID=108790 RepID=UPI00273C0386|nr:elongation of very long chain fatty acids protein AAEL008004-like [Phymastichus coffea]XP_058806720.1 elongation of very long chain fatty acids protein AAEL008004-like [Phymastichus coffea]XP_058806721.1 elongation of very long chain fatty acids protein AAEL008004-like [Phymastichus coffea]